MHQRLKISTASHRTHRNPQKQATFFSINLGRVYEFRLKPKRERSSAQKCCVPCQTNDNILAKHDRLPYYLCKKENFCDTVSCTNTMVHVVDTRMVTVFNWKCVIELFHSLVGNAFYLFLF